MSMIDMTLSVRPGRNLALRSWVSAHLNLCKALARDPAGILELDLAHVAQAFAALLAPEAVLHHPALVTAAQAYAEAGQRIVPFNVIALAGWQCQAGYDSCCKFHSPYSQFGCFPFPTCSFREAYGKHARAVSCVFVRQFPRAVTQ